MSACRNFEFLPLIMMAVIYGAMFIGMLVDYIFRAIGLYAISGKLGVDNACLAWIPYARHYQHGAIAGSISLGKREIKDPGIWMLVIPLASGVALGVAFIPAIIGVLFGVASAHIGAAGISVLCGIGILGAVALAFKAAISVLHALVNYRIYNRYMTDNLAILHVVLGLVVPLYEAVFIFMLRNKEPTSDDAILAPSEC